MSKKTKILLSFLGLGAIIVPMVLLIFLTGKKQQEPQIPTGSRQLDRSTIERVIDKIEPKEPEFPSPSPATTSAQQKEDQGEPESATEGTPSAQ